MRTCRTIALSLLAGAAVAIGCYGELVPVPEAENSPAATADAGPIARQVFRPDVQVDLAAAGCLSSICHGSAAVPMTLTLQPATDDEWRANYEETRARAGTERDSLLIDKSLGAGGHPGLLSSDPRIERWRAWVAAGAPYMEGTGGDDTSSPEPTRTSPRSTRW
jgi:hypothetical protein